MPSTSPLPILAAHLPTQLPADLFSGVTYVVNDDVDEAVANEIERLLHLGGAQQYNVAAASTSAQPLVDGLRFQLDRVTHVIACSEDFPEYQHCIEPTLSPQELAPRPDKPMVVTPEWVARSAALQVRLKEDRFSCRRDMIFSGLCVTGSKSQISKADRELLSSIVTAFGGIWREEHYFDVNVHLTTSMTAAKMQKILQRFVNNPSKQTIFAAPQWISDSWRLQKLLPLDSYQFDPKSDDRPPCFVGRTASGSPLTSPRRDRVALSLTDHHNRAGSSSSVMNSDNGLGSVAGAKKEKSVFRGKSVLLARDVCRASEQQLRSLEHFIRSSGGTVRRAPKDLSGIAQAVRNSDYVVCRYREVQEFREAIRQTKQVGNLTWLIWVVSNDSLSDPREEPLHFPVPRQAIPEFQNSTITISNYRGPTRQYITKMIKLMGATFSGSLNNKISLVVAANLDSEKTDKATEWGIPIVNHKYIVDSFLAWAPVERAKLRYIDFADGVDYNHDVGTTRVTDESLGPWIDDAIQHDEPADMPTSDPVSPSANYAAVEPSAAEADTTMPVDDADVSGVVDGEDAPTGVGSQANPMVLGDSPPAADPPAAANHAEQEAAVTITDGSRSRSPASANSEGEGGFWSGCTFFPYGDQEEETPSPEQSQSQRGVKRSRMMDGPEQHAISDDSEEAAEDRSAVEASTAPAKKVKTAKTTAAAAPRTFRARTRTPSEEGVVYVATSNYKVKKPDEKKLKNYGIEIVEDIGTAHVLVTPGLSRTPKMLFAIAAGDVAILSPDWLQACLTEGKYVAFEDENGDSPYALQDPEGEKTYGVSLVEVLERREVEYPKGIYHGHRFWLGRDVDGKEAFSKLIEAAGGQVLDDRYNEHSLLADPEHFHLIIGESDKFERRRLVGRKTSQGDSLKIYKKQLISDCILEQRPRWDIHVVDTEREPSRTPPPSKRGRGGRGGKR